MTTAQQLKEFKAFCTEHDTYASTFVRHCIAHADEIVGLLGELPAPQHENSRNGPSMTQELIP